MRGEDCARACGGLHRVIVPAEIDQALQRAVQRPARFPLIAQPLVDFQRPLVEIHRIFVLPLAIVDVRQRAQACRSAGIEGERVAIDPGFGFGKRFDENIPLLAHFADFHQLEFPLLSGTSRKSFIGRTLAREGKDLPAEQRLFGTLATVVISALNGAHIVRVHDVKAAVEALKVADGVLAASKE